ncbi:MAG TPA: ATP-binding protein, partial [Terracidiphilus sp.]|nr:ATP-binding protein [Terracidiphilus sp.]
RYFAKFQFHPMIMGSPNGWLQFPSTAPLLPCIDQVSLKPEEELVLDALRVLDKDIERIAPSSPGTPYYYSPTQRGGFMVKRKSAEQPVPIGSMGDGMWRMLAMSVAITLCKGGTLLVDEIDTGLHHTTMSSMWKLIYSAAKQFDVQVFATTHSYDCIYSLAQLAEESDSAHPISVQRVESGRSKTIPFSEQELTVAAEREIEAR